MESITNHAAEQFRNNMEDKSPAMPDVMSGVQETKGGGELRKMTSRELLEHLGFTEQLKVVNRRFTERMKDVHFNLAKVLKRSETEVWGAAKQIKTETHKLQQDTTSQSDPKVTHTAGFIQTMSEEMLKQKERLSDNKMSVKETCREVKIVLQQITDLVEDTLQSLSEDGKLKLESLIKNFRKMTASMWKLMFCALLLYKLREVLDSLTSDSYNISLSRGRLKYAFKMASMLALWLSHDVESNPGPEFNPRTCIEMLVRRFSETLREDLEIGGTIWSVEVANAAYDAGFSNNCHWKNPSGKNKDTLPDLIERAKELGRVLTDRNCLPTDLAPFAVNLDHQETQDRLRQHLKTENYRAAVNALMCEPDFTSSTTEEICRLTQLVQEKMSNVTRHHTARPPPVTTTHSEFSQLADSQSVTNTVCETNSIISNIDTRYQSKRSQRKKNKNSKTKQISNVTASEMCIATGIPCHDMLTGGTMVEGVETDSTPGRWSNSHCTLSTSTPDTTDMSHQDQNIMEAETTGNSDFVRMTLENIRENEMKSTPGTSGTDSSHASVAEHAMISDSNSFDETNVNNNSEVPSQEGRRNVDLVWLSPRNSCNVNGGVEMPDDILGTISLTPDTSDDTFSAGLSSTLFNFMQGNDVNAAVTDTDTEMNDVPLQTDTADCALPANIGIDPFSLMTGDDSNTSSSDASNPDNSPDDERQQDAADEGCEDEETDTSQPSHEAGLPTENNQLDQPNKATDRSCYEHVMMSDGDSFDETNVNNDSEVPSQEGRRNVELALPSARNTCDVNDGVEMPGDMPGHISLSTDIPDDTLDADLLSFLINCMQGDDVNTPVTDTDTEMNDVPFQTITADCALPANIGIDPFSVMTGDYRNMSASEASNPDNSPDDEDAADEGCEDEETDTSQPSHEAGVPTEDNQLDQQSTATDRCQDQNEDASREERTERHESQSVAGLGANRRNITSADTETDTEMRVITAGTDTEMRVITAGTDTEMRVITAGTDTDMRVITAGTSTHVSEIQPQADERKSAEENKYITKHELQAILYVSNSRFERRLQELEALNGLVKASTSYRADLTLNQVHLGESDTSLGSISASGGVTEEAGRRKRKRRHQHPLTKKKRQ